MAIKGTKSRRKMMATTMPMMAPGLKPSVREPAFGMVAGGASGMAKSVYAGGIFSKRFDCNSIV